MKWTLGLLSVVVMAQYGVGQWGLEGCQPVGPGAPPTYRVLNPVAKPPGDPTPNYGLGKDPTKWSKIEKYNYNGHDIDRLTAHKIVQGTPSLPDDSKQAWIVTVSKTQDDKLKAKALLSSLATKFRIQNYVEGEWYTKDRSGTVVFKTGLTVCSPTGSQCGYYTTPEDGFKDLRQIPDGFDPTKLLDLLAGLHKNPSPIPAPVPPSPDPAPSPNTITIPIWALIGGGLLLWMIIGGKK